LLPRLRSVSQNRMERCAKSTPYWAPSAHSSASDFGFVVRALACSRAFCARSLKRSQAIYDHVDGIARKLGADPVDQVPFAKYAKAAESLLKPSSAARAVAAGAPFIERVDLLVKLISHQLGTPSAEIDNTVQVVDQKLNEKIVTGGSGS